MSAADISGEDKGQWQYTRADGVNIAHGTIDCVFVAENQSYAVMSGPVTHVEAGTTFVEGEPLGPNATVTWGEFIETYYLVRFRIHHRPIPWPRIRRSVLRLRKETGWSHVFAHEGVVLADRGLLQLFREIQDEEGIPLLVEVLTSGQLVLIPEARERLERIEFAEGIAIQVLPRIDIDTVIVAGDANFGRPTIVGTNITPRAVAELVQAGDSIDLVSDLYGLQPELIDDAGRFTYGRRWRPIAA